MTKITSLLLAVLALAICAARAADDSIPTAVTVPVPGQSVIADDWATKLVGDSPHASAFGKVEAGVPGAVKLITTAQPEHVYNLQAVLTNEIALKKGDTLFIRFAGRSLLTDSTSGTTKLKVGFSKNSPDWTSSYTGEVGVGAAWQRFDIPFTCQTEFAPHQAKFFFMYGYPAQIAEIADVQLLRYGPEVAPASLPRTRRFADEVPAGVMKSELGRIGLMRSSLATARDPAPAHGRTLHVSPRATAVASGSEASPFASIPQALAVAEPGDTILVAAGEYRAPKGIEVLTSGRPEAWIKIKAAPGARPKLLSSYWSGFELRGGVAYVEIEGFELAWIADPAVKSIGGNTIHGVGVAPMYGSHHIRILNNVIHGFGTGGICALDCDYLHIEGNTIYNTAKTSPYGGSAISLCRAFDFDGNAGYHNVIRSNVCYDNELLVSVLVSSGGNGKAITDGNGIIIDSFYSSRAIPLKSHGVLGGPLAPYHGRTLIENNLVYDNGGRGIHVFRSANVDILNNTAYENQKSAEINGGEFTAIESANVLVANNIAYVRTGKRGNGQDGATNVIWYHNLFFNTADVLVHEGLIEADPLFVAPGLTAPPEGFRLQPGSPALGAGVVTNESDHSTPPAVFDLTGKLRPAAGPIDLGAYQFDR